MPLFKLVGLARQQPYHLPCDQPGHCKHPQPLPTGAHKRWWAMRSRSIDP